MTDPGLRFWLHHVAAGGGLWERAGDGVLVVLSPDQATRFALAEELVVTDDPDVARSDGVTFLGTGHPALAEAAEAVLDAGDSGVVVLARPAGLSPTGDILEARARQQLPVNHGRIDVVDQPRFVLHWVLRVDAMVSYTVSTEDHFSEQVVRWVHVAGRREVPATVADRLACAPAAPGRPSESVPMDELIRSLAEADRLIEADALRRRADLSHQLGDAHDRERARAVSYYADAIAGIERRLETAPPDRRALLEARLASTHSEQARRLAEIAEKYQAHHETRPYRLHAVGVPALRVPVEVRRGESRYPMEFDWLSPAGVFAQPRCPSCDSAALLVAGKNALGCLLCLAPKAPPAPPVPVPRPKPAGDAAPESPPRPAQPKPPTTPPARPKPSATPPAKPAARARPQRTAAATPKRADNLAATVWNAVAAGRGRGLRDALAPDAPAAALHAVYGTAGVTHAIGLPPNEVLEGFTAGSTRTTDEWGTTSGTVTTNRGEYPYVFRWHDDHRTLAVAEVLPLPPYPDGRLHAFYWWPGEGQIRYRITSVPPPGGPLDQVARLLLTTGGNWHGLAVAARTLAAWCRLRDQHERLLGTHLPAVLAAGVHRLVALRAGDKGLFKEVAGAYHTDEPALRRADAQLRKLLTLGPEHCW